jgi:hypothetical protein
MKQGTEFMCSTGRIKVGHSWNPAAAIVNKSWEKFILDANLDDCVETANQTSFW